MELASVQGDVVAGFESVREEFERNFTRRGELGAACAVCWKGRKAVDLWGGLRDDETRAPQERDRIVLDFIPPRDGILESISEPVLADGTTAHQSEGFLLRRRVAREENKRKVYGCGVLLDSGVSATSQSVSDLSISPQPILAS
jgi:hypothetical protein